MDKHHFSPQPKLDLVSKYLSKVWPLSCPAPLSSERGLYSTVVSAFRQLQHAAGYTIAGPQYPWETYQTLVQCLIPLLTVMETRSLLSSWGKWSPRRPIGAVSPIVSFVY